MTDEFWADYMADEIIARVNADPKLKELVEKNGYFCYDEKTPSGDIHIGSGRGWVIHDILAKALRSKGVDARFVLSSDDMDPFDKPIKGKPEYDQYLGMPFRDIPSPVNGYKSWADYYFSKATKNFDQWGIEAQLESTGEQYINGTFNEAIKKILDNADKVKAIFEGIYDKPYDKLPFNPICEKCKKIGTTVATNWDKETELLSYECRPDAVKWAKGCNHQGKISPYNGGGKLPWKLEWAAKWPSKGVIVELAGKDHFTKGGSRTVAIAVSSEVLNYPPPYPSTAKETGPGYEFFNLGGKKMSTSKGVGVSFADITQHIPANILRFIMVSYKPTSVIDFDPSRKNDLLLIYDRYDMTERVYYGKEESDRKQQLTRIYEISHIGPISKEYPPHISLRHAAVVVQIAGDDAIELLKSRKQVPQDLNAEQLRYLEERLEAAKKWLKEYAPEREKFAVQEHVNKDIELSVKQRTALKILNDVLTEEYTDQSLFDKFYEICEKVGIKNTDFFIGAYRVIIAKDRGPKLANFILTVGVGKVRQLLSEL